MEILPDITAKETRSKSLLDNCQDERALDHLMSKTNARIGIGCAGPRLKTRTQLIMQADHAAARDTVLRDVSQQFIDSMGYFTAQTMCKDKGEYLKRPDLGRKFSEETLAYIKSNCEASPQVQIYAADGLSSQAVEANIADVIPSIIAGLSSEGIRVGTPFFVKYGRVATQDHISELLQSDITCVLIGERPGLATAESMSAYIVYKGTVGMAESRRTVVSNIHSKGFTPVEAGAYIGDIIMKMLELKVSGVELKR